MPLGPQPFNEKAIPETPWLQRFLRRPQPSEAVAEIQTLLAARSPAAIEREAISHLLARRRVESGKAIRNLLLGVWRDAAKEFACDGRLDSDEATYLADLRSLFTLSQAEVEAELATIGAEILATETKEAARDSLITSTEADRLDAIASQFKVSAEMRRRIQAEHVAPLYQAAFDRAASDRQLSPKEETDLKELAANLGITPRYDYPTEQLLDKFRLLWRIQNDTIPTVDSSIMLQRGEVCHYSAQADWHELRTRTVRSGYSGTLTSIRIAKGLSYRIGNYTPNCVTEDVLMMIDSGTVYVTNKRVIFDGGKKNTAIRHSAIIGITPYANGVGIEKATGKSPVLVLHGDAEIAATILCEAIARS